jgi:hypothetical protein
MTDIGFAPKVVIAPQVCRLEVLDANKADTYGPQIAVKLKVVDGSTTTIPSPTTPTGMSTRVA